MCDILHPDRDFFWNGYVEGTMWACERVSDDEVIRLQGFFRNDALGDFMYDDIGLPYHLEIATLGAGRDSLTRDEAL